MQPDQVEVAFCDLCGSSVPEVDFASGAATRFQGRTFGACCLAVLRAMPAPAGSPAGPVIPASMPAVRPAGGHDARLLPVTIAVLAALAAATIFLDYRLAAIEDRRAEELRKAGDAARAEREAVQRIDVAMDGTARRADLDGLAERLTTSLATTESEQQRSRDQIDGVLKEIANLQREVRAAATATPNYGPQFDELRQQLHRQSTAIAELRNAPSAAPPAPVEAASPPPTPGSGGNERDSADELPAGLAEHARKLQSDEPAVRFEAVDQLLRSKNPAVLPTLMPLLRDPDILVRRLVVEGFADHKRPEVVEALLAGLGDADDRVRETAWRSLCAVTGQKLPFDTKASADARTRAQQRWQEWWDKNKATFGS